MTIAILSAAAVLGIIGLALVLFFQRGREGLDLSPRTLLRLYLYIASLAGVVVFAVGLASVVNFGLARGFGDELIYGGYFAPAPARPCPPEAAGRCIEPTPEQLEQQRVQQKQQTERRRNEDLLRGLTFGTFGVVFWGAHWYARRALGEAEQAMVGSRRAYLMLGTVVFGISTVVLLPTGIYQMLANLVLPRPEGYFGQGADAIGGGLVSLAIWLIYLRLVVREFRQPA